MHSALMQFDLYSAVFCCAQLVAAVQVDMHLIVLQILQGTANETATSYKACTAVDLTMSSTACISQRPNVHRTMLPKGLCVDIE